MNKPLSLEDVLATHREGAVALSDASLWYAYQGMRSQGAYSFGLLTAWSLQRDVKENVAAHSKLLHAVRSARLGHLRLDAYWTLRHATRERKQTTIFLFLIGITRHQAARLSERWGGTGSFLWAGPASKGQVIQADPPGPDHRLGLFNPHQIAKAVSTIGTATETFEGFRYRPGSWSGRMAEWVYLRKHAVT